VWTLVPVNITLAPFSASNLVGTDHTLTATVTSTGAQPAEGVVVDFVVNAGPTTGATGSDATDASGQATFTYTGTSPGMDTIKACFTSLQDGEVCARATKEWTWPISASGFMTGGGNYLEGRGRNAEHYTWGLIIQCDGAAGNFQYNDHTDGGSFHLESITSVQCAEDPSIKPGRPVAAFDTLHLVGEGRWNGTSGATLDGVYTDAGEPGRNDTIHMTITVNNVVVSSISGSLIRGNHQAHGGHILAAAVVGAVTPDPMPPSSPAKGQGTDPTGTSSAEADSSKNGGHAAGAKDKEQGDGQAAGAKDQEQGGGQAAGAKDKEQGGGQAAGAKDKEQDQGGGQAASAKDKDRD